MGNIKLLLHSLDNHKDQKRDQNQRKGTLKGSLKQKMGSSSYARQLIQDHVNDPMFIYKVNFEAGKG